MEYDEILKYAKKESDRIFQVTMDLANDFAKTEQRFMYLSSILFNEKNTKLSSKTIPPEYHPWNVSKRVHNSVGLTARSIYDKAIGVYECTLLPAILD